MSSQAEARAIVDEDAMMMAEDVRELIEAAIKTKSSINDNTQPSQSEVISGAVSSNAVGAATVMRLRTKADIAKISKNTNIAKNYIKKFKNMFEEDKAIGSFNDMLIKLHEGFNLGYSDRGRYGLFSTSDGVLSFRIKDHNANGNNFAKDNADKNISIYVAYAEYEQPETTIPYTEFRYSQEDFENNMDEIYADIINAMDKAINGDGFPNKLKFAEKKDYPQFSKVTNQQLSDAQSFLYRLGGIYKFSPISSNTFVTLGAGLTNRIVDKSAIDNARNTLTDEAFDEYVTTIDDYIADNKPNKTTLLFYCSSVSLILNIIQNKFVHFCRIIATASHQPVSFTAK